MIGAGAHAVFSQSNQVARHCRSAFDSTLFDSSSLVNVRNIDCLKNLTIPSNGHRNHCTESEDVHKKCRLQGKSLSDLECNSYQQSTGKTRLQGNISMKQTIRSPFG